MYPITLVNKLKLFHRKDCILMKSYRKELRINLPVRRGYLNITPEVVRCVTKAVLGKDLF